MGTLLEWVYYSLNSPLFPRRVPVPVLDPRLSPKMSCPTTQDFRNQKLYDMRKKNPRTGLGKEISSLLPYSPRVLVLALDWMNFGPHFLWLNY